MTQFALAGQGDRDGCELIYICLVTQGTCLDKRGHVPYVKLMSEHGGFAKVYSVMLKSTVWDNPIETRMAWIVLLMTANGKGYVRCTPFSLARDAGITKAQAVGALKTLSSPDTNSANREAGGRRLLRADGGWYIVSHQKYREFRSDSQIHEAERKAEWRASKALESLDSPRDMSWDTASASASASVLSKNGGSGGKDSTTETLGSHLRAPADFKPVPSHRQIAKERGLDFELELAKFKDHEYHRTCFDWRPRFSNWLRQATPSKTESGKPKLPGRLAKPGER